MPTERATHPIPRCIFCNDPDFLILAKEDDIFEACFLVGEDIPLSTGSGDDLKVDKMNMYRI